MKEITHWFDLLGSTDAEKIAETLEAVVDYCNEHEKQSVETLLFKKAINRQVGALEKQVFDLSDACVYYTGKIADLEDQIATLEAKNSEAVDTIEDVSEGLTELEEANEYLNNQIIRLDEDVSSMKSGRRN